MPPPVIPKPGSGMGRGYAGVPMNLPEEDAAKEVRRKEIQSGMETLMQSSPYRYAPTLEEKQRMVRQYLAGQKEIAALPPAEQNKLFRQANVHVLQTWTQREAAAKVQNAANIKSNLQEMNTTPEEAKKVGVAQAVKQGSARAEQKDSQTAQHNAVEMRLNDLRMRAQAGKPPADPAILPLAKKQQNLVSQQEAIGKRQAKRQGTEVSSNLLEAGVPYYGEALRDMKGLPRGLANVATSLFDAPNLMMMAAAPVAAGTMGVRGAEALRKAGLAMGAVGAGQSALDTEMLKSDPGQYAGNVIGNIGLMLPDLLGRKLHSSTPEPSLPPQEAWNRASQMQARSDMSRPLQLNIGKEPLSQPAAPAGLMRPSERLSVPTGQRGVTEGANPTRFNAEPVTPSGPKRPLRVARDTVYLDAPSHDLLRKQITEAEWTEASIPAARAGVIIENLQAAARQGDIQAGKLAGVLSRASDGGKRRAVLNLADGRPISAIRADRFEGQTHNALIERQPVGDTIPDPVRQAISEHPAWGRISENLTNRGYDPSLIHEEALAKGGANKYADLGLTQPEHEDFMLSAIQADLNHFGMDNSIFNAASPEVRRMAENVRQQQQTTQPQRFDAGGAGTGDSQLPPAEASLLRGGRAGVSPGVQGNLRQSDPTRASAFRAQRAAERVNRLQEQLGTEQFNSLPDGLKEGLTHWAETRNLDAAAAISGEDPNALQWLLRVNGVAPPGKTTTGRAFAGWMQNDKPLPGQTGSAWAESPYEMVRISELNSDPRVSSFGRAASFSDPVSRISYTPDLEIHYTDPSGRPRVVIEEIKPYNLRGKERVLERERAAKRALEAMGRPDVEYRVVSEAEIGQRAFKEFQYGDMGFLSPERQAQLQSRIKRAASQARRSTQAAAGTGTRFNATPPADPATALENAATLRKAGLLTSPATHERNIIGNASVSLTEEAARIPASLVDMVRVAVANQNPKAQVMLGGERQMTGADIGAMFRASKEAATRGVREGWEILKTGQVKSDSLSPAQALQKFDLDREFASKSPVLNAYVNGVFRALTAADRVFRVYGVRRSLDAQASLLSLQEAAAARRAGKPLSSVEQKARAAELRRNPSEQMLLQAIADAEVATFNNPNALAGAVSRFKEGLPPGLKFAGDLFLPFVNTPANVISRTLEYATGSITAPLRAAGQIHADIQARAKGPQPTLRARAAQERLPALIGERQMATDPKQQTQLETQIADLSRSALETEVKKHFTPQEQKRFAETFGRGSVGLGMIALGYMLQRKGMLTGFAGNMGEVQKGEGEGKPAGSLLIGERAYRIGGIPPIGTLLLMGATMAEREGKAGIGAAAVQGLANVVKEQPLLSGAEEAGMLSDIAAGKEASLSRLVGGTASSFVPSAVSASAASLDTLKRQKQSPMDYVQAAIPGLRQMLPPQTLPGSPPTGKGEANRLLDPTSSTPRKGVPLRGEEARKARESEQAKQASRKPKRGSRGGSGSDDPLSDIKSEMRKMKRGDF